MHSNAPEQTEQIKPYLDEIALRLWSENAAVMIGAGFSRNAISANPRTESFPSWKGLGDKFYEKLHGKSPSGDDAKYLSLLKLAEQVESVFGRPALNDLLRSTIPDLSYEPSPLHSQLLSLPWKDVFTTNYDTLLERARASVTLKHYEVVVSEEHLLYANNPRIVKLHGSFPLPPFTITEEDYRKYPNDHAPFVNTVRQSLLENTLCLIGFSGDDPNFLQWIGWIRDHVGRETSPNIYLVGVFNSLSVADRKILDARGIVTVDLTGFDTDPGTALGKFLEYLDSQKPRARDWPVVSDNVKLWANDPAPEKYSKIATEWRSQRKEYPGWVVVPEDRRRILRRNTERWLVHFSQISQSDRTELQTPLDLELAFELAWRLDRCLLPMIGELPAFLEEIVKKYNNMTLNIPMNNGWTQSSVLEAVGDLRLWLLRHYRELGLDDNWTEVAHEIEDDLARLQPEQKVKFQLEKVLQAVFRFDLAEARQLLLEWQNEDNLWYLEAKRAALLAEVGETAAAYSILESSLSAIRQQLSLSPITKDYTLASQESVVMVMLWALDAALKNSDVEPISKKEGSDILKEPSERWNELMKFKCDPRREMESLSAYLRNTFVGRNHQNVTHSFDLGIVIKTFNFGLDDVVLAAYGMLRMCEDFGMPYRIADIVFVKEPVESSLPHLRNDWLHWALVSIVRLGDKKMVDRVFDREFLQDLNRNAVDRCCEKYLSAFQYAISEVNENNSSGAKTFPEIFSRLCYRCSTVYRERLIDFLREIYKSNQRQRFANVRIFAFRLVDSMSIEERIRAVPVFIDFPVPDKSGLLNETNFINPILYVTLPESARGDEILTTREQIESLFNQLSINAQSRNWALISLVWLQKKNKLDEKQCILLGEELWAGVDSSSVPVVSGYNSLDFLALPHPSEVHPEMRVKRHLRKMIKEEIGGSNWDDVLDELYQSTEVVNWSKAEALDFVDEILIWWHKNQHKLNEHIPTPFGSLADNTKSTVDKAVRALASVFSNIPIESGDKLNINQLREFLAKLVEHDIPTLVLEVAILDMKVENTDIVIDRVNIAMMDSNFNVVVDAISASRVLIYKCSDMDVDCELATVITALIQGIQLRQRPALDYRLRVVAGMINQRPQSIMVGEGVGVCLLNGLERIAEETSVGVHGNDPDRVIETRSAAASLAFALHNYYKESGIDEPKVIEKWREICNDPDEFSVIRNSWLRVAN